ncbi:MAG: hypothetical protein JETT_2686 [Candidatus Jettenia ecosi]|uniref:Uncharacterized protein n=1 Tax=Candidatus Jettenia ecosi TaxID=2494326 RepID=A0A533QKF1_9BACT|nr:MAG: hypothetical protein JETT_2686 [Candidatus Jettenia ecosi]
MKRNTGIVIIFPFLEDRFHGNGMYIFDKWRANTKRSLLFSGVKNYEYVFGLT